ncbi:thiamine phosphate synthase [Clostridium zeae]|uniref:Thiamine phosphate synthase n=1 Tax=Clostridium zeae TaxID=2759022 RepID=A0ABQ1E950_9CLOT|nr:thiamine phosphate synthase [Clostridium zeae]GFZ31300.1 thiamine phosphate synthase [Clostridium zeae]
MNKAIEHYEDKDVRIIKNKHSSVSVKTGMNKGIYIITNRKLIEERTLTEVIESSVKGGAVAVILREKDLDADSLMELAIKLKEKVSRSTSLFIINGSYEVAKTVGADGLHLSFNNFMSFQEEFNGFLGVSVHSLEEAILAEQKGASYLIAGHIFETSCKEGMKGRGLDFLSKICESVTIPVIAIGGISEHNISNIMKCGAYGAAVMSSVMQSEDPESYICKLRYKSNL